MIVSTMFQSLSCADRAFVSPFQKHGWHEMGFVDSEGGLVMGRAAGGPDDDGAAIFATWGS